MDTDTQIIHDPPRESLDKWHIHMLKVKNEREPSVYNITYVRLIAEEFMLRLFSVRTWHVKTKCCYICLENGPHANLNCQRI